MHDDDDDVVDDVSLNCVHRTISMHIRYKVERFVTNKKAIL